MTQAEMEALALYREARLMELRALAAVKAAEGEVAARRREARDALRVVDEAVVRSLGWQGWEEAAGLSPAERYELAARDYSAAMGQASAAAARALDARAEEDAADAGS